MKNMLNLNGSNIKIATNNHPPFVSLTGDLNITFPGGFEIKILNIFSQTFNFTYSLIDCNLNWGTILPNNSWTGIIGQLAQNVNIAFLDILIASFFSQKADMGFCGLSLTNERMEAVQFLYPYSIERVTFMTSPPKIVHSIGFLYQVFESKIWITLLISLVVLLITIELVKTRLNYYYTSNNYFWNIFEIILNQSSTIRRPISSDMIILVSSWLLSCFFLKLFYSNYIYSLIVLPNKALTIDTIHDLLQAQIDGKITLLLRSGTSYYLNLNMSNVQEYQEIFKMAQILSGDEPDFEKVVNSRVPLAFVSSGLHINYHGSFYQDNSYYMPRESDESTFFIDILSFAFNKNYKYVQYFDKIMKYLQHSGLTSQLMNYHKGISGKQKSHTTEVNGELKLFDQAHFTIYFFLLLSGYLTALISIAIEKIYINYFIRR